jgi:hypothetical protein
MEPLLTLVIALGGIATGIGAIWTAVVTRHLARATERSVAQTEQSLAEQSQNLREQNERARINLEVDLLLRLDDRFSSPDMLASRRSAAKYIKDNFIVDDDLREVQHYNRAAWDVLNFFEQVGYLTQLGVLSLESVWNQFGMFSRGYWELYQPAIQKERVESKDPRLYEHWEQLVHLLVDFSRRLDGDSGEASFTNEAQRHFVEEECFVGEEPSSK